MGPERVVQFFGLAVSFLGLGLLGWFQRYLPPSDRFLFFSVLLGLLNAFVLLFSALVFVLTLSALGASGEQWGLMVLPLWLGGAMAVMLALLAGTLAFVWAGRKTLRRRLRHTLVSLVVGGILFNLFNWILLAFF